MQDRVEAPFKCICSTREKDKCFPTHENHNKRKVHEVGCKWFTLRKNNTTDIEFWRYKAHLRGENLLG